MFSDKANDLDVSSQFKIKWQFLMKNGVEFPIGDLATTVKVTDGEIEFLSMKNPMKDLTGQCFATNGTHNYTSSSFVINVEQER